MEKFDNQYEKEDTEEFNRQLRQIDGMIQDLKRDQNKLLARFREANRNRYEFPTIQTPGHQEVEDVHEEIPTQPEGETLRQQEVEDLQEEIPTQPEGETLRHQEVEDLQEEISTQPEVATLRHQEVEDVKEMEEMKDLQSKFCNKEETARQLSEEKLQSNMELAQSLEEAPEKQKKPSLWKTFKESHLAILIVQIVVCVLFCLIPFL